MTLTALAFLIIAITLPISYLFVKVISFAYELKETHANVRLNQIKATKA